MENEEKIEPNREHSYFRALESAYNLIFEVDRETETVKCIHGRETSGIGTLSDIQMTIESAKTFWVSNYIIEEDREMVMDYLNRISDSELFNAEHRPLQAEFRFTWIDGITYHFLSVAVPLEENSLLLCIRDVSRVKYSGMLAREGIILQNLNQFIERYLLHDRSVLGAVILKEEDRDHQKYLSILYASKRVQKFWNLTHNSYLYYSAEFCPASDFLAFSGITADEYLQLKTTGHMDMQIPRTEETTGYDHVSIECRSFSWDPDIFEFMIYDTAPPAISGVPRKGVFARTFGHFDLFVNGTPVVFSSSKEKELLALLIDRNGGTVTSDDAICLLWESPVIDDRIRTKYRKLAMTLKNTLTSYGIENILINKRGIRSINPEQITCDYYELLKGNPVYRSAFHNSYMTDYSWAESTLALLWDYS